MCQVYVCKLHEYVTGLHVPWRFDVLLRVVFFIHFLFLIWSFTSHQQSISYNVTGLPGLNQFRVRINVFAQGHKAVTLVRLERGPSVSSQALYHWATALPVFSTLSDTLLTFLYVSGSKMRALANSEDPGSTLFAKTQKRSLEKEMQFRFWKL